MATASTALRAGSTYAPKIIEDEESDSSEEMGDAELSEFLDTKDSNYISIWCDPFDMSKLPQGISLDLMKRAPFLLGSDEARYQPSFFKQTGGLCTTGYKFKQLSQDKLFPLENLIGTYPLCKKGNRHPLKLIEDKDATRDALHMYQRVYGEMQPDNGEFGTSFIRGLALFYQRNEDVNWADKAANLTKGRAKCPSKNPQKLTPPCLREQIQVMIDAFAHHLLVAYRRLEPTLQRANAAPRLSPTQSTTTGSLQRKRSVHARSTPTPPVVNHDLSKRAPTIMSASKPTRMQALIAKQHEAEASLNLLLQQKEKLETRRANQELVLLEQAAAEEDRWDEHHELRQRAKTSVADDAEMARLKNAVAMKTRECNAATVAVEATKLLISKSMSDLEACEITLNKLKHESEGMKADIDVLIVENNNIRPQPFFSVLPAGATDLGNMKMSNPCASCNKYFSDLALVPFNCGRLFHPHCMFKTALLANPVCPRCTQVPTWPWMVQWGFATNNETMMASIQASKVTCMALDWEPPHGMSDAAAKKTEEVLQFFEEPALNEWQVSKHHAGDAGASASADQAKRQCASSLCADSSNPVGETMVEVCASGIGTDGEVITE